MSTGTSGNTDFFFGFDLLYKTIEKAVTRKSDVLIAVVHFVLMKHSNFRCLGVGEDKTLLSTEVGSELLPEGWNDDAEKYALRYKANEELYLLLGYTSETSFIMNLLDVKNRKVSNITFEPECLVKKTSGSILEIIPNAPLVASRICKELIDPVYSGSTREVTTQTVVNNPERTEPLRVAPTIQSGSFFSPTTGFGPPRPLGIPGYGASDLDPLGRAGQGNLFPFPPRPNLQGSAQPRFDPFAPPDRNVPPNTNPDHMQPPSFPGGYFS